MKLAKCAPTCQSAQTKENRADERCLNELLIPILERYLDLYRPVFLRSGSPTAALWLSRNGRPLNEKYVSHLISASTLATVGARVSPHLFRTSAASAAALYGGQNAYLGSAILHHADPRVTQTHYNRATSLTAAEKLRQIVRQYEKP